MCHLDSLKMLRDPLPAKGNNALIWQKIVKCVDDLHIKNHVPECKENGDPKKIRKLYPTANLMVCLKCLTFSIG